MKQLVGIAAVAALTAGCSSLPKNAADESDQVCHYAHMASMDKVAKSSNVKLQWVNCPLIPNHPTPEGTPVRVAAASR